MYALASFDFRGFRGRPAWRGAALACCWLLGLHLPGWSQRPPGSGGATTPPGGAARYWVTLRDKTGVVFDAKTYFSAAAQARRVRQHLPASTVSDWPVRADYVAQIRAGADTVTLVSRWFNAVAVRATAAQAQALRALPGVAEVAYWPLPARGGAAATTAAETPVLTHSFAHSLIHSLNKAPSPENLTPNDLLLAHRQVAHLGSPALARARLDGKGIRIAVFDVGFAGLPAHPAFARLLREERIVGTHDFLTGRADVFRRGGHGTEVMGCLAGYLPGGAALGLAPAAEYLLARTERQRAETMGEEEAWLAAAEWADRLGADLINSSLAYTEQRYFAEQMDGRRSLIARAANLAARKGMLVVSAAGNDGDNDWVRIGTPADADSALAVGGLDPETGLHLEFSSVGPTADRRLKPNVAALGIVVSTVPGGGYERLEGTSFSAPLVAGLAACVWQRQRGLTAMQLFRDLERSAELYPYFDYAHGYGRPQPAFFLTDKPADKPAVAPPAPTFDFVPHDSLVAVIIRPEAALRPAYALPLLADVPEAANAPAAPTDPAPVGREKPAPGPPPLLPDPEYPPYLYWAIADRRGTLRRYEARSVSQRLVVQVPRRLLRGGDVLRVHFKGFTAAYAE